MHGLHVQACLFEYITVAAIHIYAQCGVDVPKRGGWNTHGNYIVDRVKSWKIMELWFCVSVGILFKLFSSIFCECQT